MTADLITTLGDDLDVARAAVLKVQETAAQIVAAAEDMRFTIDRLRIMPTTIDTPGKVKLPAVLSQGPKKEAA